MTRKLRPADGGTIQKVMFAIINLKQARDDLVAAQCPITLRKVRAAIKSAEGALRHAQRRANETFTAEKERA